MAARTRARPCALPPRSLSRAQILPPLRRGARACPPSNRAWVAPHPPARSMADRPLSPPLPLSPFHTPPDSHLSPDSRKEPARRPACSAHLAAFLSFFFFQSHRHMSFLTPFSPPCDDCPRSPSPLLASPRKGSEPRLGFRTSVRVSGLPGRQRSRVARSLSPVTPSLLLLLVRPKANGAQKQDKGGRGGEGGIYH